MCHRLSSWCWAVGMLVLFAFSGNASANSLPTTQQQCTVQGNKDFVIEMTVTGKNTLQEVYFTQGNKREQTIWYTKTYIDDKDYIFNDQSLVLGQQYQIRIEYDVTTETNAQLYYYRRMGGDLKWALIATEYAEVKNGNLNGVNIGLDTLDCYQREVQPPTVDPDIPDICPYFPAPVATNNYYDGKPWSSQLSMSGDRNVLELEDKTPLSFNLVSFTGHNSGCSYAGGTPESCLYDSQLSFPDFPISLPSFKAGTSSVTCADGCKMSLLAGLYDKITIGRNHSRITFKSGEYWVQHLNLSSHDAKLEVEGKVIIHYQTLTLNGDRVSLNGAGSSSDLTLIGHGSNAEISTSNNDIKIRASLYVDPVNEFGFIHSGARLDYQGGIVVPQILFTNNDNTITARLNSACEAPPVNDYLLQITPLTDLALTCETIDVQVQVTQKDGTLATNFTGTVTVEQTNGSTQILTPESGVLDQSIVLTSDTVMTKKVTAYITDNRTQTEVEAQYKFVPYRLALSPNPLSVIAGKAEDITVRPLECSDSGRPISSVDFEGVRELTLSKTVYDQPTDPTYSAPIELRASDREGDWVSAPDDLVLEFNKVDGEIVAVTQLRYAEAGEVSLALMDQECIEDAEGNLKCKDYSGSQTVLARPWTFAICDAPDAPRLETGSSTSGNGFVAAGESFSTLIKPIAWQGSDGQQDPDQQIETTQAVCDSAIVTQNFSAESAPSATISLAAQLASPNGGAPGHFTDTSIAHYPSNIDGGVYQLDDLSWSEVGSLKLYTSATEYLGQKINIGYRHVGRFYPAYFSIDKTKWHVPSSQGEAAYLGQPYEDVEVEVYPYNAKGQKVRNYSLFSPTYQAQLALEGEYEDRILGFDTDDAWQDDGINSAIWKPDLNNVIFSRKADGITTTKEDGPFNTNDLLSTETDFKLTLSGLDLVSFANDEVVLEAELAEQPPARYGRMTLSDVGGATSADIRVPLRVEYFDGRRFVTNGEDNATEFDSGLQCILSGVDTTAAFGSAGHQVEKGISQQLFVSRDVSDIERLEQVRLFLRQGDEVGANPNDVECNGHYTQPWLQYNWRSKGDEDPSAMITFGIYRGNDKIIFRGERGLTGR